MEEESFSEALRKHILKQIRSLGQWVKPDPADNLFIQIIKLFFKSIVVLLLTALSPIILVVLIVGFVGGL